MIQEEHWQAILNRNSCYDRAIIYAVISTKIYCLPSYPFRKPNCKVGRCPALLNLIF